MLGAGDISSSHAPALRAIPELAEIVAVCDLDIERARALQRQYDVPAAFDRMETMLEQVQPDVVHVLLPPDVHASAAEKCLLAGSHVFVEKPFCLTVEECRRVQAVAARQRLQIGVNHNATFTPAFADLLKIIRACRFGAIENVQVLYSVPMPGIESAPPTHWMFGGTDRLILEIGPHPLSICCRLLGPALSASTAVSGELTLSNGVRFFKNWQTSLVCERGNAQCTLALGAGCLAFGVHLQGEDAQAFVDVRRNSLQIMEKTPYLRIEEMTIGWKNAYSFATRSWQNFKSFALGAAGLARPYQLQTAAINASVAAFYRALAAGRDPRIGATEGTAVVEACQMTIDGAYAYLAQTEGRVVAV